MGHSSLHGIEAREIELIHWSLASSELAASLGNYLVLRPSPRSVPQTRWPGALFAACCLFFCAAVTWIFKKTFCVGRPRSTKLFLLKVTASF